MNEFLCFAFCKYKQHSHATPTQQFAKTFYVSFDFAPTKTGAIDTKSTDMFQRYAYTHLQLFRKHTQTYRDSNCVQRLTTEKSWAFGKGWYCDGPVVIESKLSKLLRRNIAHCEFTSISIA